MEIVDSVVSKPGSASKWMIVLSIWTSSDGCICEQHTDLAGYRSFVNQTKAEPLWSCGARVRLVNHMENDIRFYLPRFLTLIKKVT